MGFVVGMAPFPGQGAVPPFCEGLSSFLLACLVEHISCVRGDIGVVALVKRLLDRALSLETLELVLRWGGHLG
jgi:hypothetical protein